MKKRRREYDYIFIFHRAVDPFDFIGVPVAYSMGLSSILYIILVDPSYLQILPVRTMTGVKLLYPDVYPVLYAGG